MRKTKAEKGITLVALIITIIVLLILAVVAINAVRDEGIIDYAKNARYDYEKAQKEEQTTLDKYLEQIENINVDVPTTAELQERYEFSYYSSLIGAVSDVNDGNIDSADSNKEEAIAGIYTENTNIYVVLLKDTTETETIEPAVNMTINLGGHTLSSNSTGGRAIIIASGKVTIDGRLTGSTIDMSKTTSEERSRTINVKENAEAIINGGTYISKKGSNIWIEGATTISNVKIVSNCDNSQTIGIYVEKPSTPTVISNCDIKVMANNEVTSSDVECFGVFTYYGTERVKVQNCNIEVSSNVATINDGIYINNGYMDISNCNITTINSNGIGNYGIRNWWGSIKVSNCNIKAFSDVKIINDLCENAGFGVSTTGGTATLNNCNIMGTCTGVWASQGVLKVNGGTYEGHTLGGIYFIKDGATAYLRNATIRQCDMPNGYESITDSFNVGLLIYPTYSENQFSKNNKIYIDNCEIYGNEQSISIKGTSNKLYISNSRINTNANINIGDSSSELYIGKGCNFDTNNVTAPEGTTITSTEEVYVKE